MITTPDELLAAVVRGDVTEWPSRGGVTEQAFADAARRHGLEAIVTRQLRRSGAIAGWPPGLRDGLTRAAIQRAAVQQILDADAVRVVDALAAAGVAALVVKGAALAHTHYAHPCLRPRTDTDLVIEEHAVESAALVMAAQGCERFNQVSGSVVRYQVGFAKTSPTGVRHFYDIHWRLSDRQRFASLPSFDELARTAVRVPALGPHAYAPGPVHAVLVACVHRVAHHDDADEYLLWIHDIDRLVRALTDKEREDLVRQARTADVAAICARGLALARHWFGTPADELLARLGSHGGDAYLGAPMRKVDVLVSDLRSLRGWRARTRLLRQHLFPPAAYMREQYGLGHSALLPAYYLRRLLAGVEPWLRHSKRSPQNWH